MTAFVRPGLAGDKPTSAAAALRESVSELAVLPVSVVMAVIAGSGGGRRHGQRTNTVTSFVYPGLFTSFAGRIKQTVWVPELRSQITGIQDVRCVFGQQAVCAATVRPCDLGPASYE